MKRNLLRDLAESRAMTLAEAQALLDDPPAQMTDKMKRNLASFVSRYESQGRTLQRERYQAALAQMTESQTSIGQRLTDAQREVAGIEHGVKTGQVSSKDARRQLTAIFRQIAEDRRILDALDTSRERAVAMIEQSPATYQRENIARFPALSQRLPILTVAWLSGEDDRDPLGGA